MMNVEERTALEAELFVLENDVLPDLELQLQAGDLQDFERAEALRDRANVKARITSLTQRLNAKPRS